MQNNASSEQRPQVLMDATETQIEELERQFAEQDKKAWKTLTKSYGWSERDSQAAWVWFSQKPTVGQSQEFLATTGDSSVF